MGEDNYSLGSRVFHMIRENILSGKYERDEELKEKSIGEELGVSRTPVREALRQLELEGLVTIIPNKGAYVVGISQKDIKDIYEDFWGCTCGRINRADNEICLFCNNSRRSQISYLIPEKMDILIAKKEQELQKEKEEIYRAKQAEEEAMYRAKREYEEKKARQEQEERDRSFQIQQEQLREEAERKKKKTTMIVTSVVVIIVILLVIFIKCTF